MTTTTSSLESKLEDILQQTEEKFIQTRVEYYQQKKNSKGKPYSLRYIRGQALWEARHHVDVIREKALTKLLEYRRMMSLTDTELRIQNANERVNFNDDPVCKKFPSMIYEFLSRKIPEEFYVPYQEGSIPPRYRERSFHSHIVQSYPLDLVSLMEESSRRYGIMDLYDFYNNKRRI